MARQVSWPTDMSPTTIFYPLYCTVLATLYCREGGGVYPGCGMVGGVGRAIPGTHPIPSQDLYLA